MKFLLDNLYLFAIAAVSGGLLLWPLLKRSGSAALTPLEATQLINHRNAIVVDVREEKDFALGSLAGARNIPFGTLKDRASELVRFKARPVLIVCDAGQQSTRAIATFKEQGFDVAHSLAGGVAAWKQAGLPLVQAGRDNTRIANKDGGRKPKNDSRRSGRSAQRGPQDAAVKDAVALDEPAEAVVLVDDAAPRSPAPSSASTSPRVKELS